MVFAGASFTLCLGMSGEAILKGERSAGDPATSASLFAVREELAALRSALARVSQQIAEASAGISALQETSSEPLSHIVAMHRELATARQQIAEARAGTSALQETSSEPLSHIVPLHRELVAASEQIVEAKGGISALQGTAGELLSQLVALRGEVAALKEDETDYQLLMIQQQQMAQLRDVDPDFLAIYGACRRFTMTSVERLYSLHKCVEHISAAGISGDLAECGVWRGGSCMLMAYGLLRQRDKNRKIYLFDTYDGHPRPDPDKDIDLWGNPAADEWRRRENSNAEWAAAPLASVRRNLLSTGYPESGLAFVKGMVEETVPYYAPETLALLRLDTDWHDSTRTALQHLYPRLVEGGVLIIDDYGHYQGQRQAVDEYFASIGEKPLFHRIDYGCRVMTKAKALQPQRA